VTAVSNATIGESIRIPEVLDPGQMSAPCLVLDVDLTETIPSIAPPRLGEPRCTWVLSRNGREMLGAVVLAIPRSGISALDLESALRMHFAAELASAEDRPASVGDGSSCDGAGGRLADDMAVVVCTRERPEGLERCLMSLLKQSCQPARIIVVDNAPRTDASRLVVDSLGSPLITYVVEPVPGLSRARNRAIAESGGCGILAWIDDDEVADFRWLERIAEAFSEVPDAVAVSGPMLPAQLETWAQVRFEQYGGHSKHRGFDRAVFRTSDVGSQPPLYPLPPFGTGGNMAIRRDALLEIGGFDVHLGAGTPAMGGEDTKAFTQLLIDGGTVVYQPSAATFHYHRRDDEALLQQMYGYGAGLTAFYTSVVMSSSASVVSLGRLIPRFLRDVTGRKSLRSGHLPPDFPAALRAANRNGLVVGPYRYLEGRRNTRARAPAQPGPSGD